MLTYPVGQRSNKRLCWLIKWVRSLINAYGDVSSSASSLINASGLEVYADVSSGARGLINAYADVSSLASGLINAYADVSSGLEV